MPLLLICWTWALPASACNMSLQARATNVADYVEQGRACLDQPPPGFVFDADLEIAFIDRINHERTTRGLNALEPRLDMHPAARFQSLDMGTNAFFGHDSPDGRTPHKRIAAFDRTLIASFTAENVAKIEIVCEDRTNREVECKKRPQYQPQEALDTLHKNLMDSPGHRENILSSMATHVALGVARRGADVYVTQLFADPAGSFVQPFPLRLEAGVRLEVEAMLDDWTFTNFAVQSGELQVDLNRGQVPPSTRGDVSFRVRGEQKGEPQVTAKEIIVPYEYIYLSGPAVTVIEATGS